MPTTKSGQRTTTTTTKTATTTSSAKPNIVTTKTKKPSLSSTLLTASTATSRLRTSAPTAAAPVSTTATPPRVTFTRYTSSRRTPSAASNTSNGSHTSSSTSQSPRTPFHPKDQNARSLMVSARSPSCISNTSSANTLPAPQRRPKMPPGSGAGATADSRPRQPQLAPRLTRTPLTPKVAGGPKPSSQPVTPLPRTSRAPALTPNSKDEGATTPLAPVIASNITPRSGSRQSRAHEHTNTTPQGTPGLERTSEQRPEGPKLAGLGLTTTDHTNASTAGEASDSKFFYASDARSQQGTQQQQQPQRSSNATHRTTPHFFYASGASSKSPAQTTPNPLNPVYSNNSAATSEPAVTKFFYANGAPDAPTRPPLSMSGPGSGSTVSSASRAAPHTRPITSASSGPTLAPPFVSRPTSPIKVGQPPLHASRNASPPMQAPPTSAPRNSLSRRDSIESAASHRNVRGHSRQSSIPSMETVISSASTPRLNAAQLPPSPGSTSPLPSPGPLQPALTMATIMQAVDAIDEEDSGAEDGDHDASNVTDPSPDGLASPGQSVNNDPTSDLVANARRERKVQDLEITNASLEAINRTLERQLRRQTAELRRYRRLSRAGRLSLASGAGPASRAVSGSSTAHGALSDLSEDGEEEEDGLLSPFEEDYDSDFSSDNTTEEPGAGLARQKRDEKRLQLDLSKHQELLIDSQKINQSLKRCLDWTEDLIKEGKKALEYNVRVNEVEMGGKELAPTEEGAEGEEASVLDEGHYIYDPRGAKEEDDSVIMEDD